MTRGIWIRPNGAEHLHDFIVMFALQRTQNGTYRCVLSSPHVDYNTSGEHHLIISCEFKQTARPCTYVEWLADFQDLLLHWDEV